VETQIFQAEGQYIAETAGTGGNIIHGFENYLKSASTNRKRVEVSEIDRVFSQSSITYRKVRSRYATDETRSKPLTYIIVHTRQSLDMADDESSIEDNVNITHVNPVTGVTTVTLTPATRAQEAQVRFISFLRIML
jgi:chromatin modification-related protein EAF6